MSTNEAETAPKARVEGEKKKKHNKYRREKPWDNEDIDHWKVLLSL